MQIKGKIINTYQAGFEDAKAIYQRPKGKWKLSERGNFIDIVCPYCNNVRFPQYAHGFSIEEVKEQLKSVKLPDYCESCGADMRKEKENV